MPTDRIQQTIRTSIYEQYGITRLFDVNSESWAEVQDRISWAKKLPHNHIDYPDFACCALAVEE